MKIGLVIFHADPARGGAERYTVDIARSLARRGHDVSILASSFSEQVPWELKQIKLETAAPGRWLQYRRFLDQYDQHILANSYDVLHAMLPMRWCDLYHPHAGLAIDALSHTRERYRGLAKSVARGINQLNLKRRSFANVERRLLTANNAPIVVCLSEYMKQAIRRHYPLKDEHLVTLLNAVDLEKFNPNSRPAARETARKKLGIPSDHTVALIVAQDFERKGLREAIMALPKTGDKNLRLIVVGGDNASTYKDLASYWEVGERVIFIGQADDVYPYYRAADFFVLPTRHDPCSLVVLEAIAMGLPVITTKLNGAVEAMRHGVDGLILPERPRIDELAEAMRTLCDPETRQKMSDACLARRSQLSFDQHINALVNIYQRAAMRRTRGENTNK